LSESNPQSLAVTLRRLAETLCFAAAGGLGLGFAGMPAGFLSGSILAVAAASLAGRPILIPRPFLRVLLVAIGISLGSVVTPETLQGMARYPLSIATLVLATTAISVVGTLYLRSVHGWDTPTAYLAAVPGGLSQVLTIALEIGADMRAIAIVQSIRVVIVAVGLPAGLAMFGLVGPAPVRSIATLGPFPFGEMCILVATSAVVAIIFFVLRFPGGLMFGAMITSAALHGSGLIQVVMPTWVTYSVMIAFGSVTGSRFANTPIRMLMHYIGAAFGSFAVSIGISAIFATALV
jgi:membrane AbrB-like protein